MIPTRCILSQYHCCVLYLDYTSCTRCDEIVTVPGRRYDDRSKPNFYRDMVQGLKYKHLQSSTTSMEAPPSFVTRRRVFINIYRLPN